MCLASHVMFGVEFVLRIVVVACSRGILGDCGSDVLG